MNSTDSDWQGRVKAGYRLDAYTGIVYRLHGQYAGPLPSPKDRKGYVIAHACGRQVKLHRLVWLLYHGSYPTVGLDHMNGVRDDNRPENLRLAGYGGNARNRRSNGGRLKPKGVYLQKGKFRAEIYLNYKKVRLGYFDSINEAAHAYNKAAVKLYGEFACLNPI